MVNTDRLFTPNVLAGLYIYILHNVCWYVRCIWSVYCPILVNLNVHDTYCIDLTEFVPFIIKDIKGFLNWFMWGNEPNIEYIHSIMNQNVVKNLSQSDKLSKHFKALITMFFMEISLHLWQLVFENPRF